MNLLVLEDILSRFPYVCGFQPSADDNTVFERLNALDFKQFPNCARWQSHVSSIRRTTRSRWPKEIVSLDCTNVNEMLDIGVVQEWTLPDDFEERGKERIAKEREVSSLMKTKLDKERVKNWNRFYKRNDVNFFKDRHYLTHEFFEKDCAEGLLLEIGSGVGNSVLPLCEEHPKLRIIATDCSDVAINLLRKEAVSRGIHDRLQGVVCDATREAPDELTFWRNRCDYVLILFCLSAIDPEMHQRVIYRASSLLKPGGQLLLRDYGRYDYTQIRFAKEGHRPAKIKDNFYTRQDGTFAYFFAKEEIVDMCSKAGLDNVGVRYILREITNRKTNVCMPRIWLHGIFRKPIL